MCASCAIQSKFIKPTKQEVAVEKKMKAHKFHQSLLDSCSSTRPSSVYTKAFMSVIRMPIRLCPDN